VGTANPGSKLEVNGVISTTNAGTSYGDINAGSAGVYSFNGPSRYIRFNTNGGANDLLSVGAAMVVNYSGGENVEFFGSSPATAYVNGNLSLGGGAYDIAASTRTLTVRAGTAQSATALFDVKDNGGTNHYLYVAGGGNVGIGTTSPFARLSVAGNTYLGGNLTATGTLNVAGAATLTSTLNVTGTTDSTGGYLQYGLPLISRGNNSNFIIGGPMANVGSGDFNIAIGSNVSVPDLNGNNQLNIANLIYGTGLGYESYDASGNVGIGTSSPSAKLSVAGDTFLGGDLTATGILSILGTATSTILN